MLESMGILKKQHCNTVGQMFCSYLMTNIYANLTRIILLPIAVGGRFVVWLAMIKTMILQMTDALH